jgi:hypothetical protein
MPTFLVRLAGPVIYQADSLMAREVIELTVRSDTEDDARSHVHRVTRGKVQIESVTVVKP